MGRGVRVIRLERIRERLDRRDEGSLQALGLVADRLVEKRVLDHRRSVWREDLEQANVVLVELLQPELREDDHTLHLGAATERHGDDRLLDVGAAGNVNRELAALGVGDEERLAPASRRAGDPFAHLRRERLGALVRVGELPVPRRRNEELARPDVDAAAVAVEERPELAHDRLADRRHVVQPAELPGEAL